MGIDKSEVEFHKMIQALAGACSHNLDGFTVELYDRALSPYGYDRANSAMWEIFTTRRGGDRFPSVGDILEKMGINISPRAIAVDCANLIFFAFNKWKNGYTSRENFEDLFREHIGDLPWEVISRMGGYRALYKEWDEATDKTVLRAQVRDAALSLGEINRYEKNEFNQIAGDTRKEISSGKEKGD